MMWHFFIVYSACQNTDSALAYRVPAHDIEVETDTEVPTLVHVRWETLSDVEGRVVWTLPDGTTGSTERGSNGMSHAHTIFGIPAGTSAELELLHVGPDGTEQVAGTASVTLNPPPDSLPLVTVLASPEEPPTPFLSMVTMSGENRAALQVVDWQGRPIWWLPEVEGVFPFATALPDGSGFTYAGLEPTDAVFVASTRWTGATKTFPAPGVHHQMHVRDDGVMGACVTETIRDGGRQLAVDVLTEFSPDGTSRRLWSSAPLVHRELPTRCDGLRLGDGSVDATHCNGVTYDATTDSWVASFYCSSTIVAVDAQTGVPAWILGGVDGTLEQDDGAKFALSHAPDVVDGALRLFDNGSAAAGSRVAMLTIDPVAETAELLREWRAPAGEYTPILGAQAKYGDGALVSFGAARAVYWLEADGETKAHLEVEPGYVLSSVGGVATPIL